MGTGSNKHVDGLDAVISLFSYRSAGVRTPRSNMKQGTQTRDRTAQACSKPYTYMKTRHDGSVRALPQNPWMPPDRSDRTLILPPPPHQKWRHLASLTRDTKNKTGTWQHKNMTNMTTQDWHTKTNKTRKSKHRDKEEREGGRGAKPVPAGKPRQSQVSREGQEGWVREAQAVQESQKWARMEPEGRTREVPAKQQPWKMVRAGPEGQTRRVLARQEAKVDSAG